MRTSDRGARPTAPPRRADTRRPGQPAAARAARAVRRGPQEWFAQQLLLVLSGQRPVHSLLGHAREGAYDQLVRLAPHTPLRPPRGERWAPLLRRVGVCRPGPGVIEAFACIAAGARTRALAFRLERSAEGRWLCCAVEMDTVP